MFYDPTFVLLIPAILLGIWAQWSVNSSFKKWSKVPSARGLTGAQAARMVLDRAGLHDVRIEGIHGKLSDHYDPRDRVLRLSPDVGNSNSLAAVGVAAHEAGHALQHAQGYVPLAIRSRLVPVASLGSTLLWPLVIGGFLFQIPILLKIGIVLYAFAVLFHLVTLPVEFNASARAIRVLSDTGILVESEIGGAKKVLSAAAMTYVAATLVAIIELVRLVLLSGMGRDD
ncbi:MAG: zinc metallopeptidase [Deltaproteobacteria bacterium]|nr:zinc metallopeptidase [Deltaproteobacteria bacterium]